MRKEKKKKPQTQKTSPKASINQMATLPAVSMTKHGSVIVQRDEVNKSTANATSSTYKSNKTSVVPKTRQLNKLLSKSLSIKTPIYGYEISSFASLRE